jgi:hypothetical protein
MCVLYEDWNALDYDTIPTDKALLTTLKTEALHFSKMLVNIRLSITYQNTSVFMSETVKTSNTFS